MTPANRVYAAAAAGDELQWMCVFENGTKNTNSFRLLNPPGSQLGESKCWRDSARGVALDVNMWSHAQAANSRRRCKRERFILNRLTSDASELCFDAARVLPEFLSRLIPFKALPPELSVPFVARLLFLWENSLLRKHCDICGVRFEGHVIKFDKRKAGAWNTAHFSGTKCKNKKVKCFIFSQLTYADFARRLEFGVWSVLTCCSSRSWVVEILSELYRQVWVSSRLKRFRFRWSAKPWGFG